MPRNQPAHPLFDRVCTIFCTSPNIEVVPECVKSAAPLLKMTVRGGAAWKAITLKGDGAVLVLNKTRYVRPGFKGTAGAFNKITLGAGTFFREVRVRPTEIRERLLKHISQTQVLIGCVATPAFVAELGHYDLVFGIARAMDGLVFDGHGMLDGDGKLILDKDGNHGAQAWKRPTR